MVTVRSLFVLGLSICAAACTADADRAATDTAAQTSVDAAAQARGAASALFHLSALLNDDATSPSAAAFREWIVTTPTATFVDSRTYYFESDKQRLVVGENGEARFSLGPRPASATMLGEYDQRMIAAIVAIASLAVTNPAHEDLGELRKFATTNVSLDTIDSMPLPHGSAGYSFEGTIHEGDAVVGTAKLRISAMQMNPGPGPDQMMYVAHGERTLRQP